MSANNFVTVEYNILEKEWHIWERNADTGSGVIINSYETRDGAIDEAVDYVQQNTVEYGITHISRNVKAPDFDPDDIQIPEDS